MSPGPSSSSWYASSDGQVTSTNAKRRISAYDISKRRFLSNTFMVARIRHDGGEADGVGVVGRVDPGRHQRDRVGRGHRA